MLTTVTEQTINNSLPMYDEQGERMVPKSISDVPFGRAVRVLFTLEYYFDSRREDATLALAQLGHIALV